MLRITQRGIKSFSVIYRVAGEGGLSSRGYPKGGKQHRITLGQWPIVELAQARIQAREIRLSAAAGIDPRHERTGLLAARIENTVASTIDRYIDRQAKVNNQNWRQVKSHLDRLIKPEWGNRVVSDITRSDAHKLLDKVAEERGPKMASEVRKQAGRLFSWALDRELVTSNPFFRMDRPNDEKYAPKERHLSDSEIQLIWQACENLSYPYGTCIQLLILTGLRKNNMAVAKKAWISSSEKIITVPKMEFKSNRVHEVPLSTLAWAILEQVPLFQDSEYIFKAIRGNGGLNGWSKVKIQLDQSISSLNHGQSISAWTIHDIRHTVKTGLSRLRINSEIKDRVLGHAKRGMDAIYDHHDYRDEKREALEMWATHISSIVKSETTAK